MRNQKYIVMSFLAAGALIGFTLLGLLVPTLARMEVGDPQIFGLVNATSLVALVVAVVTFVGLNRHPLVVRFSNEVITELRRVTWPEREETVRSSAVVVGTTLFVALMLAIYDYSWAEVTSLLLFTEG